MIPVSLTIKGLYSYQQETTIDFTNLTAAGLFGIFGAVGSGKSTILEAISFALYGETERLNKSDKRSYNMMNLRSKHLLIDFIFTCGDCDHKYKFTVNAKRNSKNFSDGGKIDRQAYIWQDNWVPTTLDAERILGLSYDNFKRTIIIPQGKFQEFLQLKEGDRVQMLKEIFGLDKFELSPKVARLSKENELKVSHIQGQMQALPLYDEELLKEKEGDIYNLNEAVIKLTNEVKNKQSEEKALQDLKTLFADVNVKTIAMDLLQGKEKDIDELDRQVKEFEKCEQVFKYPIKNRNKLRQTIDLQQSEAKNLQANKAALETTIQTVTNKVDKLRDAYTNREVLLQKAAELEKIVSIKSLQDNIATLSARIENGNAAVNKEEDKLEIIKGEIATLKSEITSIERSLPDTSLLISISNWFNNKKQLETNLKKAEKEASEISGKVSALKTDIELELKQLSADIVLQRFPESLLIIKGKINELFEKFDQQLQILIDEQNHLKLSQKLDEFARALTTDSECPLCGSVHHPKVYSAASVTEELKEKLNAIQKIEDEKRVLHTALINLSGRYSTYETYLTQNNQRQQELQTQKENLEKFVSSFSFPGYCLDSEDLVKKQLAEIEEKNVQIKKLRKQHEDKDKELDEVNKKIATFKAGIEKFKTEKAQQEGQAETLKAQVLLYKLEAEINKTTAEHTINAASLKAEYTLVTKEFEQAEKAVQENTNKLSALSGRLEELQKQIEVNIGQKEGSDKQIADLLAAEGYRSEQDVEKVLGSKLDIKKEMSKVETFRRELHSATVQLKEAIAKVEGKEYSEELHEALKNAMIIQSKELSEKTEKLITERNELRELIERMQTRLELQKDLDKLILRAENLKILSNLFRGSGFVNYVSSVYLENLINSANDRFHKMTRQKLMLELADDNSFRVRDFMNNGEVRSVKTLSGGQTFQAALSLALALADNIQHLTRSKQNFFFLDEGFGSLDKEALAIVFDTLKNLRRENRIVGVISHVDEMQQEIQVNLKIVNDIEKGSIVTKSWN